MSLLNKISAAAVLAVLPSIAEGQLRVVTYNTLDKPINATASSQARTIFDAIANTSRNGVAKRPDIIALQEQRTFSGAESTGNEIAEELNDLFGVDTYDSVRIGSGFDLLMYVFDTSTVSLEDTSQVFAAGAPRATLRGRFQPVGYSDPAAELYLYNSHLKAGSSTGDRNTRATEATAIRNNADALGPDTNVIYLGDLNLGTNTEIAYSNYLAPGNGEAFDPINLGSWPNFLVAEHLTQSTRTSFLSDQGATGGMDDRFDLQLVTNELLDGEGLSYIGPTSTGFTGTEHSYQAFGNDGNTYNQAINNNLTGRSQSTTVINALHDFSDHLPVVADYQLPAVLQATAEATPALIGLGQAYSLEVTVSNIADVLAAIGADELDYSLTTTGDVSGAASGSVAALAAGDVSLVELDTSTPGLKTGMIEISNDSLAGENKIVQIPISYEVANTALAGDFNEDGAIDSADYARWRNGLGVDFTTPMLDVWRANFGLTADAGTLNAAVPEPLTLSLAYLTGVVAVAQRRRTR